MISYSMAIEDFPSADSTMAELDRDLAEITNEIQFLEDQLQCDLGSYSPEQLMRGREKIADFKKKAESIQVELERRKANQ